MWQRTPFANVRRLICCAGKLGALLLVALPTGSFAAPVSMPTLGASDPSDVSSFPLSGPDVGGFDKGSSPGQFLPSSFSSRGEAASFSSSVRPFDLDLSSDEEPDRIFGKWHGKRRAGSSAESALLRDRTPKDRLFSTDKGFVATWCKPKTLLLGGLVVIAALVSVLLLLRAIRTIRNRHRVRLQKARHRAGFVRIADRRPRRKRQSKYYPGRSF